MDSATEFASPSVIAILRGIQPDTASDIANVLIEEGIRYIEVPLNSPNAFQSIENMIRSHQDRALFGAGTVLNTEQIARLHSIGAKLVVSPHCDPSLIEESLRLGLIPIPGFYSPTEAFAAINSGATVLKFFPAQLSVFNALSAVLPQNVKVIAVGGVSSTNIHEWKGVHGFGIGSSIFRPHYTLDHIRENTRALMKALRDAQ